MANLDDLLVPGVSSAFVETMYRRFLEDPKSVDPSWQSFFGDLANDARALVAAHRSGNGGAAARGQDWRVPADADILEALSPGYVAPKPKGKQPKKAVSEDEVRAATLDSIRALMMIRAYRVRGHLKANLDPLGLAGQRHHVELDPASYGFTEKDMDRPIFIDNVLGLQTATVREILEILQRTYCSTVGVEFMHIFEPEEKAWIQEKIEGREKEIHFTVEGKRAILQKLTEAEVFEQFLARKYIGTKRFGLDGGESLIPAMEAILKTGGRLGVKEVALGMAHRGRLNVLANVLQKPFRAIFHEFHGGSFHPEDVQGSGDVKYHLGTSADREFDGNRVYISLTANPSHLEAVNPVVLGKARAKLTQRGDRTGTSVMPLLLHGDAAFAGQGVVAECFDMMGLKGYRTGGTLHIIINNQIGFTTDPAYSRSSPYPSDTAKMVQAPIFHVNGDDPEAVVYVTKLATEFRQTFKKDAVIDMFCYRRFGHNEGDEPAFTQPLMYQRIRNHPTTREIYARRLIEEGVITPEEEQKMRTDFENMLEAEFEAAQSYKPNKADWLEGRWSGLGLPGADRRAQTGLPLDDLRQIGRAIVHIPEGFEIHRTLKRVIDARATMIETGENLD
ncbi:MAG TPA: thiamine pyrophosphate-dependent enzyme [Sphingomonadales bacterium]